MAFSGAIVGITLQLLVANYKFGALNTTLNTNVYNFLVELAAWLPGGVESGTTLSVVVFLLGVGTGLDP